MAILGRGVPAVRDSRHPQLLTTAGHRRNADRGRSSPRSFASALIASGDALASEGYRAAESGARTLQGSASLLRRIRPATRIGSGTMRERERRASTDWRMAPLLAVVLRTQCQESSVRSDAPMTPAILLQVVPDRPRATRLPVSTDGSTTTKADSARRVRHAHIAATRAHRVKPRARYICLRGPRCG
jgi:hypothetical protein